MENADTKESVSEEFATLRIEEKCYHVHINVRDIKDKDPAKEINKKMIEYDGYDPQRGTDFPSKLMSPEKRKLENDTKATNYNLRRAYAVISIYEDKNEEDLEKVGKNHKNYYESWYISCTTDLKVLKSDLQGIADKKKCRLIITVSEVKPLDVWELPLKNKK